MKFTWKNPPGTGNPTGGVKHGLEEEPKLKFQLPPPAGEKGPEGTEAASGTPETGFRRERSELAGEVRREKSGKTLKEKAKELSEAKDYDPDTLQALQNLDIRKRAKDQPGEWAAFEAIASVMLCRMAAENPKALDGVTPADFLKKSREEKRYSPGAEAAIIGLIGQMEAVPDAALRADLDSAWQSEIVSTAREIGPHIPKIEAQDKKGWDSPLPKGERGGVMGFLQEHPNIRKYATMAGVGMAGFLIGRWIFRKVFGKAEKAESKKEEGGLLSKLSGVVRVAAVATMACFAYGYLKRNVPDWTSWLKEKFHEPDFKALAKRLAIEPEALGRLGPESYKKFMSGNMEAEEGWGWLPTFAAEKLGADKIPSAFGKRRPLGLIGIPGTGISIGEANQVRNFLKDAAENPNVQAAFKKHSVDLNDDNTTLATVLSVLNEMEKNGELEKVLPAPAENPDNDPENDVVAETGKNSAIVAAKKTFDELEDFSKDEAPHIRGVLEKWKKRGLKGVLFNMGEFAKDLTLAAAKEDEFALIISGSQILLWNGVKYCVVASGETLADTFKKAGEAVFLDSVSRRDVINTYFDHAFEFMVIGGALGFIPGVVKSGKFGLVPRGVFGGGIPGMLRGGLKGALFPVTVAYKTVRAGAFLYHEGKEMPWRFKRVFSGAEAHAQYWGEQARMEAEAYRRWFRWREALHGSGGTGTHPLKNIAAKYLIPEDIERYVNRYGSKFSNAYSRFTEAYNAAHADEIEAGTRKALEVLKFDPTVDARRGEIMQLINDEFPETKTGTVRAPTTFEEALEAEKLRIDPKKTKLAKYWSKFSAIIGPSAAALTIYQLETAEDKKKAVAEVALGWAGFIGGVTVTERVFKNILEKNPKYHALAVTLGGITGAIGLNGGLEDIVNEYFMKFPGAYKVSAEVAHMIELSSGAYIAKGAVKLAGKEAVVKAAERAGLNIGLKGLEEAMMKRLMSSSIGKGLASVASKKLAVKVAERLGIKLGARGAALAAGHAIPGLNVIALGVDAILLPFMAKDMYDIYSAWINASKLNELMRERREHGFQTAEVIEPPDAKAQFSQKRTALLQQGEGAVLNFLEQFPTAKVRITREGMPGSEVWLFQKGAIEGLAVYGKDNEVVASMESKDMERLGEKTFPKEAREKQNAVQKAV